MKNRILLLFLIQFLLLIPQLSIAKIAIHSPETHYIQQQSKKVFSKKKIRPLFKKKPTDIKKMSRSFLLFLLSAFCAVLSASAASGISFVFLLLTVLFGLMGISVGYSDWKKHRSLLAGLGFVLNLILSGAIILLIAYALLRNI
jgi:hypothetical protein